METASNYLLQNLKEFIFIGRTKKECQLVSLSFEKGYITWNMQSSELIEVFGADYKYFDSFFGFLDWIEDINKICKNFVEKCNVVEKLNKIVDMVNTKFTWYKFMSKYDTDVKVLSDSSFKSKSFKLYLGQLLKVDDVAISQWVKKCSSFLSDTRLLITETPSSIDFSFIDIRLNIFEQHYNNEWCDLLNQHYQVQDKFDMYGAIKLGSRINVPYAAAYRFLKEKEHEKDPQYRNQKMLEARMKIFA